MAYVPSQHTTVSKPIGISGNSTDARSRYYDITLFKYRDYVSTAEVISYLSTAANRKGGFPILINSTGVLDNGVITGGTREVWWFKDGEADGDLIKMELGVYDYNDLQNLPTLFSGNYDDLDGKPNQGLNTDDSPSFSGITISGGTQTSLIKSSGSGYGSALYVETYGPQNAATPVINFATVASSDGSKYKLNFHYQTPPTGYGLSDASPTIVTFRRNSGGTVAYLEEVALKTGDTDIEITDSNKGIIFKAPTGERVRMTMTVVSGVPTPVYTILI